MLILVITYLMQKVKMEFKWKQRLLGDHAIVLFLPEQMDSTTAFEIKNFNDFIVSQNLQEIKDIIPSYHTITLIYKIELLTNPIQFANDLIEKYLLHCKQAALTIKDNRIIEVPVCYDEIFGIDLKNMSSKLNLTEKEIIKSQNNQRVYTEKLKH